MPKISDSLARQLSNRFIMSDGRIQDREAMRDYADIATGSELDCTQLDLLTDWMWRRCHVNVTANG